MKQFCCDDNQNIDHIYGEFSQFLHGNKKARYSVELLHLDVRDTARVWPISCAILLSFFVNIQRPNVSA
jgi:hypothetical protein